MRNYNSGQRVIEGVKHVIKNSGKTTVVVNYTKWGTGLLVRNQQIKPGQTTTISYQKGTFYCANPNQIQTISQSGLPEKTQEIVETPTIVTTNKVTISETPVIESPITKEHKILLSTAGDTRYDLFEKFLTYYTNFGFDILVVNSNDDHKNITEYFGGVHISIPSEPNGVFKNEQIRYFEKNPEYTHVLIVEPNIFLDPKIINSLIENSQKIDVISWSDSFLVNDFGDIVYQKPTQTPISYTYCLSRHTLNNFKHELWDERFFTSSSQHVWNKLQRIPNRKVFSVNEFGGVILKFDTNPDNIFYDRLISQKICENPNPESKTLVTNLFNQIGLNFLNKKKTQQKNLVTVIITNYNTEKFISNAIESCLSQTHKNIEIIVLDDNSTDGSLDVLSKYRDIPNVHIYLYNQNMGPYWLRNSVLDKINGEFLTILDSDDVDDPEKFEKQIQCFNQNPELVCVSCQYERIDEKVSLGYPSMMFKKKVIDQIGYFDSVRMGADSEFYERVVKVFGKKSIHHISEVLQRGVRRSDGLTRIVPENSSPRTKYTSNFLEWHRKTRKPFIKFPLDKRPFDISEEFEITNHQKLHEIKKLENPNDILPVIMCVWKREDGFAKVVKQLSIQKFRKFKLFVWNNNPELKDSFENILKENARFDYEIHHSESNVGGFGRFLYAKKLRRNPKLKDYCVFIDDDQTFGDDILEIFNKEIQPKTLKSQYGWKFKGLNYYVDRVPKKAGEELHYAGTGGMVIDMSIFEDEGLFDCPKDYWYVEDLWLSFYSNHVHGYKVTKSAAVIKNGDDQHSLYKRVKDLKTPFLNYLVQDKGWNIL
jgi:glycosyltransferase involved in cell wall biosynthesis